MRKPKDKGGKDGGDKGGKDGKSGKDGKDGKDDKGGKGGKDNGKIAGLDIKQIDAVVKEGQTTYTAVADEYADLTK